MSTEGEDDLEIEIVGSGGALPTPRPGCHCSVCDQAREKGAPYARGGPAVFIHGANVLFDTPEEIREQLNRCCIERVDACFYSHWHPDHVMGRRVFESLNHDAGHWPPEHRVTDIYLPQQVAADSRATLGTWNHLSYMEEMGILRVHELADGDCLSLGDITVTPFRLAEDYVYAFVVEKAGVRALIAADELYGWSPPPALEGVDLAILPMGICEHDPFTGERRIAEAHPVLKMEMTFPQTLDVIRALRPRQSVLSHIEEIDGLGHDDLERLAAMLHRDGLPIRFAHDAMRIHLRST